MARLLVLDGNSLAYRAFYGVPADMATASGQVTNAVYGFTSMLINLLRDHKPRGIAVAFDRPEPTFRHTAIPDYKAGRQATPDILRQQMGLIRQVIDTLGIPVVEMAGFEADDCLATLATAARDDEVIIVTGDRDTYQLVKDPQVKVLYNRRGVSDYLLLDEAGVREKTGVTPEMYVQYAALRGDVSDNLPGVAGVGEKTAAKLINELGGIDGIYAHLDKTTPKVRESLRTSEEHVRRNVEAMTLVRTVPLEITPADIVWTPPDPAPVRELFGFLEFRSLIDRYFEAVAALTGDASLLQAAREQREARVARTVTLPDDAPAIVATREQLDELIVATRGHDTAVAAAWAAAPGTSAVEGLAIAVCPEPTMVWWLPGDTLVAWPELVRSLFESCGNIHAHHTKVLLRWALRAGVAPATVRIGIDTAVAAYLLDPADQLYDLAALTDRYAGMTLANAAPKGGQLDLLAAHHQPHDRALDACAIAALVPALQRSLEAGGLMALYSDIEAPLVWLLARMEHAGIAVDRAELERLSAALATQADELEAAVHHAAGHVFNVNSTTQLRTVLFDELGLSPQKKTKTGYSTDAATLERLRDEHPVVDLLLRYREVEKLRSTYGESLLSHVGPDDRIHATFTQTVARTGRLSSENPNLHNIPVRSEEGRRFRRCFVAPPGRLLLVADYDQIELRVIAHLSSDPGLVAAFAEGRDIHNATAAAVFGVAPSDVTIAQRSKAKMVSYGLAYGMEAYGLGQRLGVPTEEAAEILRSYFAAFPAVRSYMDDVVAEAKSKGYTETLFGRRRKIPELLAANVRVRQAGERQAMNAPIQGLAADIFKVALLRVDEALQRLGLAAELVLQVHDEVVVEVDQSQREATEAAVREAMVGAAALAVPLAVNVSVGTTWADAKG